jgi:hypothetical protein
MSKFSLGQIVITAGAHEKLNHYEVLSALIRHSTGDWGDVCEEDKLSNDQAVEEGSRILSSYQTKDGTKFWIITEWDRSVTTVLLPSEY